MIILKSFVIDGIRFYHYSARDSHGSGTSYYSVNDHGVSAETFFLELKQKVEPLRYLIEKALDGY